MNLFVMITAHYFKRAFRDIREVVLLLAIPLGLVFINSMLGTNAEGLEFYGYNVIASIVAHAMILSFQFFTSTMMVSFLYNDFKKDMRWRLKAAPHKTSTFLFPAFAANWLFSLIMGVIAIVLSAILFNVYWGNLFVLAAVLLLVSLIAVFATFLIYLLTDSDKTANAMTYVVSFGMMILSGFMIPLQLFGDNFIITFLRTYGTPLSLGTSAIFNASRLNDPRLANIFGAGAVGDGGMEEALLRIGILAGMALVLAVITFIIGRRRVS